jgi:hypothetical protein
MRKWDRTFPRLANILIRRAPMLLFRVDAVSHFRYVDSAILNLVRLAQDPAATAPQACRLQAGEIVQFLAGRSGLERYHSPHLGATVTFTRMEGGLEVAFTIPRQGFTYLYQRSDEDVDVALKGG